MPELIDRKYLLAYLAEIKPDEYVSAFGEAAVQVIGLIEEFVKEMPTIDPEVRQPTVSTEPDRKLGHWIMMDADRAKCSLCGWWQKSNGKDKTGKGLIFSACYHYCTACGARMDGGADNG